MTYRADTTKRIHAVFIGSFIEFIDINTCADFQRGSLVLGTIVPVDKVNFLQVMHPNAQSSCSSRPPIVIMTGVSNN